MLLFRHDGPGWVIGGRRPKNRAGPGLPRTGGMRELRDHLLVQSLSHNIVGFLV